ncbi:MAG: PIG-L family deacetylase [Planctomycetes bacterium]|nr:PIG-L family deacetylase [Planctomycetota bacterium]
MRVMCVHAHFDDYEFTCAGTFELLKRRHGDALRARVVVCTDGAAGHHFRTRAETAAMRLREQEESARRGGYEFRQLRYPDGSIPREACLAVSTPLLAALWREIRDFAPDYLFCPPVAAGPLAGIHVDHETVGQAVRRVAYMVNVPHAFTPEYPADETRSQRCPVPVIINAYDHYLKGDLRHDLAVDIDAAFDRVAELSYCHRSQIEEWLPWVSSPIPFVAPTDLADWSRLLRARLLGHLGRSGLPAERVFELFCVTSWGAVPTTARLLADLPGVDAAASNLEALRRRLGERHPTDATGQVRRP